jgi:hypothetical protein
MSYPAPASDGSLYLAFPTLGRIVGRKPPRWSGFTGSMLAHALAMSLFFVPALVVDRVNHPAPEKSATTIFAPPPPDQPPPDQPEPQPEIAAAAAPLEQPRIALPEPPPPEAPVNLSSIQLSIADDVHGQLPNVVQAQGGMLALLDKDDLAFASYVFEGPAWEPVQTTRGVSRMLRIEMYPPRMWAVFRDAAERGVALENYRAFALFPIAYRSCLQNAIRRSAKGAAVSAVVLQVAPDSPCGFQVQEVTLAASPALHP